VEISINLEHFESPSSEEVLLKFLESFSQEEEALSGLLCSEAKKINMFVKVHLSCKVQEKTKEIYHFFKSITTFIDSLTMKHWLLVRKIQTIFNRPLSQKCDLKTVGLSIDFESIFHLSKDSIDYYKQSIKSLECTILHQSVFACPESQHKISHALGVIYDCLTNLVFIQLKKEQLFLNEDLITKTFSSNEILVHLKSPNPLLTARNIVLFHFVFSNSQINIKEGNPSPPWIAPTISINEP
jgi:hypothetical protein